MGNLSLIKEKQMNKELAPCPFCGDSEDLQINLEENEIDTDDNETAKEYIWCYACNVSGPSSVMPQDAWNQRPIEDELLAKLEAKTQWQKEALPLIEGHKDTLLNWLEMCENPESLMTIVKQLQTLIKQAEEDGN